MDGTTFVGHSVLSPFENEEQIQKNQIFLPHSQVVEEEESHMKRKALILRG